MIENRQPGGLEKFAIYRNLLDNSASLSERGAACPR